MSRRSSSEDASPDIYTGLLAVSLTALLIGVLFLYLELSQYSNSVG